MNLVEKRLIIDKENTFARKVVKSLEICPKDWCSTDNYLMNEKNNLQLWIGNGITFLRIHNRGRDLNKSNFFSVYERIIIWSAYKNGKNESKKSKKDLKKQLNKTKWEI